MKENEINEIWNEICYHLSESIKPNINEKEFEHHVVRAIESLGWREYKGEIERQQVLPWGRQGSIIPDLVIYNPNRLASIVIEVKRPSEDMSKEGIFGQLKSYMRQVKADFGLMIGKEIRIYYDGYLNLQQDPLLLEKIPIENESKNGKEFVEIFNRNDFLEKKYEPHLNKMIDQIDKKRTIEKLIDILLTEKNKKKIYQFLKIEYDDEFGSEIVTEALRDLKVELSVEKKGKSKKPIVIPPSRNMIYIAMEAIRNARGGITHEELKKATGLTDKQLNNVLFKLKNKGMIESPKRAFYIAKNEFPTYKSEESKKRKKTKAIPHTHNMQNITMEAIRNAKDGITFEELKKSTGLKDKQLNNVIFKLRKKEMIEIPRKAFYIAK